MLELFILGRPSKLYWFIMQTFEKRKACEKEMKN